MIAQLEKKDTSADIKLFKERFAFRPEGHLLVGVEREFFLTRNGRIAPICKEVLDRGGQHYPGIGYELSACQIEYQVGPCRLLELHRNLVAKENVMTSLERNLEFKRSYEEVAPLDMPLTVFPDAKGRYASIARSITPEALSAACRVIGTHVHVGMSDHETALAVYNQICQSYQRLSDWGDHSAGERLALYRVMAPLAHPPVYASWDDFYSRLKDEGSAEDPRSCYHLIRLSIHGTIEFRTFGSTSNLEEVVAWARECHRLCTEALEAC